MQDSAFLTVDRLSKRYGKMTAVDDISFSVPESGVFGLLGPNGAGKTTTIKMLCGLLKADAGNISLNGISMSTGYAMLKSMIGLCPQELVIWEQLTCYEQLKFVGISYGLSSKEAGKRGDELLEALGLAEKRNRLAGTLSGGMQRRLNMLLALVHHPRLIILDEPQAGLDPQSRVLVRDYIRHLAKRNAIILTTHDMDEADRLSDQVAIMDHGKILMMDTPEGIKQAFGAGDVLQVRISGLTLDKTQRLLASFSPFFTERTISDGLLLLGAKDVIAGIPLVHRTLKEHHVQAEDLTIRKRTLEDAFISMTGRGLRE